MATGSRQNPAIVRAAAAVAPLVAPDSCAPLAKVFNHFDRCYLLNLDRDADRLARASARLRRLRVPFERFGALGPPAPCPSFPGKASLTPGLFACARSHLAVLRRAMQRGERRVLIVEDDAVFRDDAAEWMVRLVPQLESVGWDVLHLGLHLVRGEGKVTENLGRVGESFHTHAYAVTSRAMPVLAAVIEASMREGFHFDCFDHPLVAGAGGSGGAGEGVRRPDPGGAGAGGEPGAGGGGGPAGAVLPAVRSGGVHEAL